MKELGILKEIEKTSSRKEKENIIKANKDNPKFLDLLQYAFNDFYVYNLNKIERISDFPKTNYDLHKEFIDLANILKNSNINDNLRITVNQFLKKCNELQYEIYSKILTKTLKIGITAKTINKVIPNFLPLFEVMLADSDKNFNLNQRLYCEVKKDGVRVLFIKEDGKVKAFSRKGKLIPLPNLNKILENYFEDNFVLDTEIFYKSRTITSGLINSAIKGGEIDDTVFTVYMFDFIKLDEFLQDNCQVTYDFRKMYLINTYLQDGVGIKNFQLLDGKYTKTKNEVIEFYNEVIKKGEEGLIVKTPDHLYRKKRSKDWIKFKQEHTTTLKILDWVEGTGKDKGKLGAFVVASECRNLVLNIGSGLSDYQRELFWKDRENLRNKLVEIKYNELQQDKYNNYYLFLPIFIEVREDKEKADTLSKIIKEYK